MPPLKNKKILLICAKFFGYEKEIAARLRECGAIVCYYDQRPSNTFLTKALIRVRRSLLERTINRYFLKIIQETSTTRYDFVLFISPESITKELLNKLKDSQASAMFLLYMWDSFRNKSKAITELIPLFDCRFSFDKEDCRRYSELRYRPLFFLKDYQNIEAGNSMSYDLLFIGTIHSDRYKILKRIKSLCKTNGLKVYYYMYFPSRVLLYFKFIFDPSFWSSRFSEFSFDALNKDEVLDLIKKSKVVIDIQHPRQIGLTMRTIEVLGAQRKLITTNPDICNYDFFDKNNILVIDRDKIDIDNAFFEVDRRKISSDIYNKYSIDGWINDIFMSGIIK